MLNMRLFDRFTAADIAALPKKLKHAVIADRKAIVTDELRQNAASRTREQRA